MKHVMAAAVALAMAVSAHAADISLQWDASSPATNVAGYEVGVGPVLGSYMTKVDAGSKTVITLPALANGTYHIAVRAYNTGKSQYSAYSNSVVAQAGPVVPPPPPPPPPPPGAPFVGMVSFDLLAGQDQDLNGQYPVGVIDWGTASWYHSAPWQGLPTKSVSFRGAGLVTASFKFIVPRRLVSIEGYNGGASASTVTLTCAPWIPVSVSVVAKAAKQTILTGWTGECAMVTVGSSNGWDTNFDSFVVAAGAAVPPPPPPPPPKTLSCVAGVKVLSSGAGTAITCL